MEHGFTIKDAIFLILILAAIVGLFSAILTVKEYGKSMQNPMGSCMAEFDLNRCVCYDMEGRTVPIKSINYNVSADLNPFRPEYSKINDVVANFTIIGDKLGTRGIDFNTGEIN
jgi:hypothetical protein